MNDTPQVVQMALDEAAAERDRKYADYPGATPLVDNYLEMAMAGEWAFGLFSGLLPDFQTRPYGDGGIDFYLPVILTVDVKTVQGGKNLLHKEGNPFADVYVLADYDRETKQAALIGWAWGRTLRASTPRDFGRGYRNHHIERENLRPMSDLRRMMAAWRRVE
jgi:hypothetical protein